MGCWNGTCFLSHLPIESGEKVKIIFLKKNKYVSSFTNNTGVCEADNFFKPLYLPVSGVYDDYGGIKDVDNSNISSVGLEIFKYLVGGGYSDKIITDSQKKLSDWNWENIWRSLERGIGKFYLVEDDEDVEFGKDLIGIMIRQDVWDSVVKIQLESEYSWDSQTLNSYLDGIWECVENENLNDSVLSEYLKYNSYDRLFNFYNSNIPFRKLHSLVFDKSILRDNKLSNLLEGKEFFDIDILKSYIYEMYAIHTHLSVTRRIWGFSGSGAGCQSTNWDIYQKIYQVYSDISKEKQKELDEYDDI